LKKAFSTHPKSGEKKGSRDKKSPPEVDFQFQSRVVTGLRALTRNKLGEEQVPCGYGGIKRKSRDTGKEMMYVSWQESRGKGRGGNKSRRGPYLRDLCIDRNYG